MSRLATSVFLATLVLAFAAPEAAAQYGRGRDRSESPRGSYKGDKSEAQKPGVPESPFYGLERELPSLKVDLMLTAEQVEAWSLFERDVRDVAEMDRARIRRIFALRERQDLPGAVAFISGVADSDRQRAEATADLRRHLESLYDRLDDKQKRLLDRRVVLSQTEPLGGR